MSGRAAHISAVSRREWAALLLLGALSIASVAAIGLSQQEPPELEQGEELPAFGSLKTVPVPVPPELAQYVRDVRAAVELGKALFWDMQVGSDGVTACASCHFHAGADPRTKNAVSPGLLAGDTTFTGGGPNRTLTAEDFPFRRLADMDDRRSEVLFDTNDVVSSMGVFAGLFERVRRSHPVDAGQPDPEAVFLVDGVLVRTVEPRNSPSVINAVFNYANFHDGRADFYFNGINGNGALDRHGGIFVLEDAGLVQRTVRISYASLASQAVGPPLNSLEMSLAGRNWPDVGRKLLNLRPLGRQLVHPHDSVLGSLARARLNGQSVTGLRGLNTTYAEMVRRAFQPEYWQGSQRVLFSEGVPRIVEPAPALQEGQYTHMEANFPLFFGLALQMYQATLVSDDSPFDRYWDGNPDALTRRQKAGMEVFVNQGRCATCHLGPELTAASVANLTGQRPDRDGQGEGPIELMQMFQGVAFYDTGFYNVAARPTAEDIGRGGVSEQVNPRTGQPYPLSFSRLAQLKEQGLLPEDVAAYVPNLPRLGFNPQREAVAGAMKTPSLRNVELTGPYLRNGGLATLRQVVDFYNRGADFAGTNLADLARQIEPLGLSEQQRQDLVEFMLSLTDERVRLEQAPFDHPQLFVPLGLIGDERSVDQNTQRQSNGFQANEQVLEIPPVGAQGRAATGLAPLRPFLDLDPHAR